MGSHSADYQISASADDAFEDEDNGAMHVDEIILQVESDPNIGSRYWGGLRFQGSLPALGATILQAYLTPYIYNTSDDDANFDIYAEAAADASAFTTSAGNITGRTLTDASVPWVADSIGAGWRNSPSLVSLVQELVNSYTLIPIVFILKPRTDAAKTVVFGTQDHAYPAKLHLVWTDEPGTDMVLTDEDCGMRELDPDSNYDGGGSSHVHQWGKVDKELEAHWLARCDFSLIPLANTITAAALWLYNEASMYSAGYEPSENLFGIYRCLREWVAAEATYNQASDIENWAEPGAQGATDVTDTDGVERYGVDDPGWFETDVTDLVAYSQADDQILNIALHSPLGDIPADQYFYMNIHSYLNATNRPYLLITHTSPGGVTRCQVIFI